MARALIVDDDAPSARLVRKYLVREGHEVEVRLDGRAGLELAMDEPPDVMILDVMMPGLSGFDVCRRLRTSRVTRDLPVIFLSACGDLDNRVAGLDFGAVDYLVKPFAPDDLLARVRAALRTSRARTRLQQANAELRSADETRRELVGMLAHDIRGLLGAVSSAVEMAKLDLEDVPHRDAHRFLDIAERNTGELVELTTNLLDTYRLDEGRLRPRVRPIDLRAVADDIVERLAGQAEQRQVRIAVAGAATSEAAEGVLADPDLLLRVLLNLVTNALKFSPAGGQVTIDLAPGLGSPLGCSGVVTTVRDQGPGIAPEDRDHLFERFTPLALPNGRRQVGSGLGLAFCRKALALMGGEIWLADSGDRGSTFAFVLPAASDPNVANG